MLSYENKSLKKKSLKENSAMLEMCLKITIELSHSNSYSLQKNKLLNVCGKCIKIL